MDVASNGPCVPCLATCSFSPKVRVRRARFELNMHAMPPLAVFQVNGGERELEGWYRFIKAKARNVSWFPVHSERSR